VLPIADSTITLIGNTTISSHELSFRYARSSGPGGQRLNKVSTRATLLFNVSASPSLTASQKARVRRRLGSRINRRGILRVVSSKQRTQAGNRRAALNRFIELMADALSLEKPRRASSPPASADRKRRRNKEHRARLKEGRRARFDPQ
jgi:ribosome-associated protein